LVDYRSKQDFSQEYLAEWKPEITGAVPVIALYGSRWTVRMEVNLNTLWAERRRATGSAAESREGIDGEPVRCRRRGKKAVNSDFSDGKLGV
jgi:hypothetical protein